MSDDTTSEQQIDTYTENITKTNQMTKVFMAFYIMSYIETISDRLVEGETVSVALVLVTSLFSSLIGAAFSVLFFGVIWFWLAGKIMKGESTIKETVITVGEAFFKPSIFALVAIPFIIMEYYNPESFIILTITFALLLTAGIWALIDAMKAVKKLNSFSPVKMLFVGVWPLLLIVIFAVITSVFI